MYVRYATLLLLLAAAPVHADPPAGSIKGTVIFEGEPPTQPTLDRKSDPKCAKDRADEAVVVEHGKLRDVLVRIKNGSVPGTSAPAAPVVIDQRDCMYTPRVVGMMAGQRLVVRNSDNTFHNVHGTRAGKLLFNKPQAAKDKDLDLSVEARADDVIELQCDVHRWMHAYAVVQDHPFFAVTDGKGQFEITGLAPGKYTLEAWHPVLGSRTMDVEIGKGKRGQITARFSYKAD